MNPPIYYSGKETKAPERKIDIDVVVRDEDPGHYIADEKLAAAVNVAIILGKPLLLTGDPGTGKTRLAEHVALALGLDAPERFDTKSTSQAGDLFYRFDSLARFHSAHAQEKGRRALDFITFGPLGTAILRTLGPDHRLFSTLQLDYPGRVEPDRSPVRSVVLVDEIDKAPRDFPNDLLDAIDNKRFTIRELERDLEKQLRAECETTEITAAAASSPIVIITSNSEKNLPDPFLRRCVYYHLTFPDHGQLFAIVARRVRGGGLADKAAQAQDGRLSEAQASPLLRSAVALFTTLRGAGLRKQPSTAELIDWMRYLVFAKASPLSALSMLPKQIVRQSLGVLVKSEEDLAIAHKVVDDRLAGFDGRLA